MPRTVRQLLLGMMAIVAIGLFSTPTPGATGDVDRTVVLNVRSACVLNFARFATWPAGRFEDASSPLVIGIIGPSAATGVLEATLAGRTASGHPLELRVIQLSAQEAAGRGPLGAASAEQVAACHLLYVPGPHGESTRVLWPVARDNDVLLVVDDQSRLSQGGMIAMPVVGSNVRPVVNQATVRASRIQLSSRLLQLSERVRREPRP
ncbi:MAG: YfiR family protein [Phycisphaerales bacterium]